MAVCCLSFGYGSRNGLTFQTARTRWAQEISQMEAQGPSSANKMLEKHKICPTLTSLSGMGTTKRNSTVSRSTSTSCEQQNTEERSRILSDAGARRRSPPHQPPTNVVIVPLRLQFSRSSSSFFSQISFYEQGFLLSAQTRVVLYLLLSSFGAELGLSIHKISTINTILISHQSRGIVSLIASISCSYHHHPCYLAKKLRRNCQRLGLQTELRILLKKKSTSSSHDSKRRYYYSKSLLVLKTWKSTSSPSKNRHSLTLSTNLRLPV